VREHKKASYRMFDVAKKVEDRYGDPGFWPPVSAGERSDVTKSAEGGMKRKKEVAGTT